MKNLFLKGISTVINKDLLLDGLPYWIYDYDISQKLDYQGEKLRGFASQLKLIQLRIKSLQGSELFNQVRSYSEVIRQENPHCKIIMNDHISIALDLGLDGVHLGQNDDSVTEARATLGDDAIVGLTIRSAKEAKEAVIHINNGVVDYVGLGTIFNTSTKKGLQAKGPDFINEIQNIIPLSRIYPIGGINKNNLHELTEIDVLHVAICSELYSNSVSDFTISSTD